MITQKIEDITVSLYTDAEEYTKDFFDIPEGAILDTEDLPESAGFACIKDNSIWIYKREDCCFYDLLSTIAHELGHLVEGGYRKNPPDKMRYDKKHEEKANHYEDFVMKAYRFTNILIELK